MSNENVMLILTLIMTVIMVIEFWRKVKEFIPINAVKKRSIKGRWKAVYRQNENNNIQGTGIVELNTRWRKIYGKVEYNVDSKGNLIENQIFNLKGGLREGNILMLNYETKDTNRLQYGKILLKLHSNGNSMNGMLIGYGYETEEIVTGDLVWERID